MVAPHGAGALAARIVAALEARRDADAGAVIAKEHHQGVFAEAELVEFRHKAADHFVHVGRHIGEVFHIALRLFALDLRIPVRAVGRGLKRVVREDHRIVEQKRVRAVARDKIEREIVDEFGTVFTLAVVDRLAVELQTGIRITRGTARLLPEKRFIEAEVLRQPLGLIQLQLPFTADAGGVARLLEELAERGGLGIEDAKFDVVSDIVDAGH